MQKRTCNGCRAIIRKHDYFICNLGKGVAPIFTDDVLVGARPTGMCLKPTTYKEYMQMLTGRYKPKRKRKPKKEVTEPILDELRKIKVPAPKRIRMISERRARRLSQAKLGQLIGCSASFIGHLETGRSNPSADIATKLVQVLEVSFYDLFPDL
ncbi:helix-turn-helix transcriptional regulator [Metasolibacillus meyeri]|uniref:Helix-turn-helix transcriptional regulator n=1 Tax=Metasolibacillus meyeri TaxID=1071052 RepID=A0AAW9NNH4_9BACL|nr:helix-turn-helix transcriptional regulator [Metasolibacillus meyeri]MEC1177283.1 helix-turn-helix transcriptional regulator [Metasolibacillus meyeri]